MFQYGCNEITVLNLMNCLEFALLNLQELV
jgi:hypothetical protein